MAFIGGRIKLFLETDRAPKRHAALNQLYEPRLLWETHDSLSSSRLFYITNFSSPCDVKERKFLAYFGTQGKRMMLQEFIFERRANDFCDPKQIDDAS